MYPLRVRLSSVRLLALVLISATSCAGSSPSTGVTESGDDSAVETRIEVDQPDDSAVETSIEVDQSDDLLGEVDSGVTIVANEAASHETSCEGPCPSTLTLHDATGAEFGRVDFDGYAESWPLVSYPERMVLVERMSGAWGAPGSVHLLDTDRATSSELFELQEGHPIVLAQLGVGGRWLASWFPGRLVLADLQTGQTHLFEGTTRATPVVLAEHQGQLAIVYQTRIDVLETEGLTLIASVDLSEGERLIDLSPGGSQLAVGMVPSGPTGGVRLIDLKSGDVRELEIAGSVEGFFSIDRLLITRDWTAWLLDIETGKSGESIESRSRDFTGSDFGVPPSVPWHISRLGTVIALTHIETGERIEGAGLAGMSDGRVNLGSVMWVTAQRDEQSGIGFAMLDLRGGEIVLYKDATFGLNRTGDYRYSRDRRQVLIPRRDQPSVVLANGQITELPSAGQGTFCSDDTVVIAPADEAAARYRYQSGDVLATVGPQAHVQCAS